MAQLVEGSPGIQAAPDAIPMFYKPDWAAHDYNYGTTGSVQKGGKGGSQVIDDPRRSHRESKSLPGPHKILSQNKQTKKHKVGDHDMCLLNPELGRWEQEDILGYIEVQRQPELHQTLFL